MLLVLDLDGTLLNHNLEITPATLNFLQEFVKNNDVLINSGREYRYIFPYVKQIDPLRNEHIYVACVNGSEIYQYDKIIKTNYLNKKQTAIINNLHPIYHLLGKTTNATNLIELNPKNLTPMSSINLLELQFTTNKKYHFYYDDTFFLYKGSLDHKHLYYVQNDKKHLAAKYVQRLLHLKTSEVFVFGDDYNDTKTLMVYPNSFLMKNSTLELKNIKKTLDTNENDGILKTLNHVYFKKHKKSPQV